MAFYLKMSTGVPIDRISHQCPNSYMRNININIPSTIYNRPRGSSEVYGGDGKKMGGSNSTPKPRGWKEIVSEELEGVSDGGCPTTKKKVVVPYPDDKVRNLGVTSNDWDDILEEFNNGMAGYWSSAAHTGPISLVFLVGIAGFFLAFFGVVGGLSLIHI